MDIESFRNHCLNKKAVTEGFPFDESTLVFKVAGKMFAIIDVEEFSFTNLKSNPDHAIDLRESYQGVKPGWHMNKTHWNSVYFNSDVPDKLIYELIDNSYELIVESLTKKARVEHGL